MSCSICSSSEHNKRTCPESIEALQGRLANQRYMEYLEAKNQNGFVNQSTKNETLRLERKLAQRIREQ